MVSDLCIYRWQKTFEMGGVGGRGGGRWPHTAATVSRGMPHQENFYSLRLLLRLFFGPNLPLLR